MEISDSHKLIKTVSAKKIQKPATRKKPSKIPDSAKLIRRISPKINSPGLELSGNKGCLTGRTLSSEFTVAPCETKKALVKAEKEQSELLLLYSKMSDELAHLKTLEKLDKQKEKQISSMKNKLVSFSKEKGRIQNNIRSLEMIFNDFLKKMEKGFLSIDEKKVLARQVQEVFAAAFKNNLRVDGENEERSQLSELWAVLPRLEKVLKMNKG